MSIFDQNPTNPEEIVEQAYQIIMISCNAVLANDAAIIKKIAEIQAKYRDALIEQGFSNDDANKMAANYNPAQSK